MRLGVYPAGDSLTKKRPCAFRPFLFCLTLTWLGCGCEGPRPLPIPPPLTRQQALNHYNANVEVIPPFSAWVAHWEVKVTNDAGKTKSHADSGKKAFYRPGETPEDPAQLYLLCSTLLEEAFVIGSNQTEFWMYSRAPNFKRGWWGKYEHIGKPCAKKMPFHPQSLLELLGLRPLPAQADQPPYPLYKVGPEENIIEYVLMTDDGLSLQREIIIDRRTDLPREINVYDHTGQRVMQSRLDNYQQVGSASVPGDILIRSADGNNSLYLQLRRFKVDARDRSSLFIRPDRVSGIEEFTQIDEPCE